MYIEPVLYEVSAPQLPIEESIKPIETALLLLEKPIPSSLGGSHPFKFLVSWNPPLIYIKFFLPHNIYGMPLYIFYTVRYHVR